MTINHQALLKATGNAWRVEIYADGNFRKHHHTTFVRASCADKAESSAIQRWGGKIAIARPWNPDDDRLGSYIQKTLN